MVKLGGLQILELVGNKLSGQIPVELGNAKKLNKTFAFAEQFAWHNSTVSVESQTALRV